MVAMVATGAHPAISCDPSASGEAWPGRPSGRAESLPLVLEADLELDPVLDDLPVLDDRGGLHHLDRLDVADGLRRGGDGLARGVTPRPRARADHLTDDVDAHRPSPPGSRVGRPGTP